MVEIISVTLAQAGLAILLEPHYDLHHSMFTLETDVQQFLKGLNLPVKI